MRTDRTVHGLTADGDEIVRYDRAGKWYVEWSNGRRLVTVRQAAAMATEKGARAFVGRLGGMQFDAEVRQLEEMDRRKDQ